MYKNEDDSNKLSDVLSTPIGMIIGIIVLIYGMATKKYFLLTAVALYLIFAMVNAVFKMLKKHQQKKLENPEFAFTVDKIVREILAKHDYSIIADDKIKRELKTMGIKNHEIQNEIIYDARIANVSEIDSEKFL